MEYLPRVLVLTARARVYELLRKVHGARFAREVQNNSLPRDLRPRSASRSLWTTLMIPCAGILLPASLPHPRSGVQRARSQNERSVGGLGTAMMTLNRQTRKNYLLREEDYGRLRRKIRSSIEILIFYDGCTELR